MSFRVRSLAFAPLMAATLGACLPALAPGIRPVQHHAGLTETAGDDTCMSCHEAEQRVLDGLAAMSPRRREASIHQRMQGGGASLVAQWMLDDERTCVGCHVPRRGLR
ncbi:MAG: hypothetical protein ACRBN8_38390 [Nannocystales bacterium]